MQQLLESFRILLNVHMWNQFWRKIQEMKKNIMGQ